jgi:hypothetical protein
VVSILHSEVRTGVWTSDHISDDHISEDHISDDRLRGSGPLSNT